MSGTKTFAGLVNELLGIINLAIPLIFAVTLVLVIWKVSKAWIIDGGDAKSIEAGKQTVLVAVIALVFMVSVWGIVQVLQSSLWLQ